MQNGEQTASSLWTKVAGIKPREQLYVEYSADQFKGLNVEPEVNPELYEFIEDIKKNGPRFYGYPLNKIEQFAEEIYELRKDNSNNTAR